VCVIIDTNVVGITFGPTPNRDAEPLLKWLIHDNGVMIFGGRLANELRKTATALRFVNQLRSAGRAKELPSAEVRQEEHSLHEHYTLRSNDAHVLALARLSGARVLFTDDYKLRDDFKNRRIIRDPGGRIYASREHAHLLRHHRSCRYVSQQERGTRK